MPIHHPTQSQLTLTSVPDCREKFRNPPWWNRRTRLERSLITIVSVTFLLSIGCVIAFFILGHEFRHGHSLPSPARVILGDQTASSGNHLQKSFSNKLNKQDSEGLCLTPGCVKAAAEIIKNLNEKVEPCDDFYEFSCGGWLDSQVIPDDRTSVSVFSQLQDDLNHKLRILIEKPPEPSEPQYITKMRSMYNSCMDLKTIEKIGNRPVLDLLNSFGGWPVLNASQASPTFNWVQALIQFRKTGFSHDILLDLSVTPDFRNNTIHVIDLDQASLGMPDRSYLLRGLNDTAVAGYYRLMVESSLMLGAPNRTYAEQEMLKVLEFETLLANFSLPREARRNISALYNKMTIEEIQKLAPNTDWMQLLGELLSQNITKNDLVIVNVPSFLIKVDQLLLKYDRTILQNYMMWRVVMQCFATLGKEWRDLAQSYNKLITGQDREEPRWEQCMATLTGSLGIGLSSLYVKNHFKSESKKSALEMVQYIHTEFLQMLNENEWMDKKTIDQAIEKAKTISTYIGYPDQLLDDDKVGELYENLTLNGDYFNNVQNLRKWSTDYAFNQLRKPNLKEDWKKHAKSAVVNAFYNALYNSIEFPAGILQGSFFDAERPNYMNYGSIGFVIGHEITHGFDDRGRQFDKEGNNKNWWQYETDMRFRERAQCIIDQYGNYTVPENGLKVNGINTQGENIADNGGLKEAFRAYNKWAKKNGEELRLPGLKYNTEQLFWISAANVWCGKYRPEVLKLRVLLGSHSPSQFRVIGPMSNIAEFSQSFNCKPGKRMNPIKKCNVW